MGAIFGTAIGISGIGVGLSIGFATPIDLEEPILVNSNEWEIAN